MKIDLRELKNTAIDNPVYLWYSNFNYDMRGGTEYIKKTVFLLFMNIAVAQSGGPTSAINASLAGVYLEAVESGKFNKIYGSLNGIEGIIKQNLIELSEYLKTPEDVDLLIHTPSTVLGSCRYKIPEENAGEVYEKILGCFRKYDIGVFFYIGGNDSMDTVMKLSE